MAYIIDENLKQPNLQVVMPADPVYTFTDAQKARIESIVSPEAIKTNKAFGKWIHNALTTTTPTDYEKAFIQNFYSRLATLLQPDFKFTDVEAKIKQIINDAASNISTAASANWLGWNASPSTFHPELDKEVDVVRLIFGDGAGQDDIASKIDAAITEKFKDLQKSTEEDFINKQLHDAFVREFAKYGIDATTSSLPAVSAFMVTISDLNNAKASQPLIFSTASTFLAANLSSLKRDNLDPSWGTSFLDSTKTKNMVESLFVGTKADASITKQISDSLTKLIASIIKPDATALTPLEIGKKEFQTIADALAGGSYAMDDFDARILPGFKALVQPYGITNLNKFKISMNTESDGSASLNVYLLNADRTFDTTSNVVISKMRINLVDKTPVDEQAKQNVQTALNGLSLVEQTVHEADIIAHVRKEDGTAYTPLEIYNWFKNGEVVGWKQITKADFIALTQGQNGQESDFDPVLTVEKNTFTLKYYVTAVQDAAKNWVLKYRVALEGGNLQGPADPSVLAHTVEWSPAQKYISNEAMIKSILANEKVSPTDKQWLDEIAPKGQLVSTPPYVAYIKAKTTIDGFEKAFWDGFVRSSGLTEAEAHTRYSFAFTTTKGTYGNQAAFMVNVVITDNVLKRVVFEKQFPLTPQLVVTPTTSTQRSVFDASGAIGSRLSHITVDTRHEDEFKIDSTQLGSLIPIQYLTINGKILADWIVEMKNTYSIKNIDMDVKWSAMPVVNPNDPNDPNKGIYFVNTGTTDVEHYGSIFTFTVELTDPQDVTKTTEQIVKVFVAFNVRPATKTDFATYKTEYENLEKDVRERISVAIQAGNMSDASGDKLLINGVFTGAETGIKGQEGNTQQYDGVAKIRAEYLAWLASHPEPNGSNDHQVPTVQELKRAIRDLEDKLHRLNSIIPGDINVAALIQKIQDKFGPNFHLTEEMIKTITENAKTLQGIIDKVSASQLLELLKYPRMLQFMNDIFPPSAFVKFVDFAKAVDENYKYGYFGAGAALGLVGVASAAAAISTGRTAVKTAKQANSIKIRGHKLISIVTSVVSLATLGGAAALMIYFFTQQGGF